METRRIGSLEVSVVGLGCNNFGWRIDESATRAVVDAALDAGINFFDTADIYGRGTSEEFLGRALGRRRRDAIIATKFGKPMDDTRRGARPEYIRRAADDSLRRLRVDHIDLYQIHEPDPSVPIADTLGALNDLVDAGKVREIGCSNFSAEQLREAIAATAPGAARFVSVQNNYSLLDRSAEHEVLAECERMDIAFLPYYPLASGLLTGKYRRDQPLPEGARITDMARYNTLLSDRNLDLVESLTGVAEARGRSLLDLAIAWLIAQPAVASVIAGATSPAQVRANVAAADWTLSPADLEAVDSVAPATV